MRAIGKSCHWRGRGEVLLGQSPVASSGETGLIDFLIKNIDVFAWNAYEAPKVDPNFICHHLNVNPSTIPKKQLPRRSSREPSDVVKAKSGQAQASRGHKGGILSRVAGQHSSRGKENWEMVSMCRLHRFEQNLPK